MGEQLKPFTKQVLHLIQHIPEGSVMTYGQIAELAGNKRGARQVARILHAMSRKYGLPWHRVVNAQGEIAIKDEHLGELQKQFLEQEGVPVIGRRVDLRRYRTDGHIATSFPAQAKAKRIKRIDERQ